MAKNDTLEVERSEYEALVAAQGKLLALEAAGVQDWEGYHDAVAGTQAGDEDDEEELDDEELEDDEGEADDEEEDDE